MVKCPRSQTSIQKIHRKRKTIEEEDTEAKRLEVFAIISRDQKFRLQEEVVQHTAGNWSAIKIMC